MQRERRRDPYPWTWEIPAAVVVGVVLTVAGGIQLARSLANLLAGGGWTWPAADTEVFAAPVGSAFWTSLPAIVGGRADAGLRAPAPDRVAGSTLLWTVLVLMLAVWLVASVRVGVAVYRWGPGRVRGMATAAEAETLLGRSRLRKVAAIVRPDLTGHAVAGQVWRTAGSATHTRGLVDPQTAASRGWSRPSRRRYR